MKTIFNSNNLLFRLPVFLLVACVLTLSSCKKSSTTSTEDDSVSATDEAEATTAMNSATDDASYVAGNVASLSGTTDNSVPSSIGGATVDTTSASTSKSCTITYSGYVAGSLTLKRTGQATVTLVSGASWSSVNAVLEINFNNVVYTDGGSSITLNGIHYLTNITGGRAWKIADGDSVGTVQHKHTANNFTITFANGTQRTWSVNRLRTYAYPSAGAARTITIAGDTTVNGYSNVDDWGTNRFDVGFTNVISTPIVVSNVCGWFKPYQGEDTQYVDSRTVSILFGVDASGIVVTSGCADGFWITYTKNGNTKATLYVPYWY